MLAHRLQPGLERPALDEGEDEAGRLTREAVAEEGEEVRVAAAAEQRHLRARAAKTWPVSLEGLSGGDGVPPCPCVPRHVPPRRACERSHLLAHV